jgi:hypothetical protein
MAPAVINQRASDVYAIAIIYALSKQGTLREFPNAPTFAIRD